MAQEPKSIPSIVSPEPIQPYTKNPLLNRQAMTGSTSSFPGPGSASLDPNSATDSTSGKGQASGSAGSGGTGTGAGNGNGKEKGGKSALFIGELHWWTTDVDLLTLCQTFGIEIEKRAVSFSEHKVNGKSKGIAFVAFDKTEDAERVKIWLENNDYQRKRMTVSISHGAAISPFRTLPKEPYATRNATRTTSPSSTSLIPSSIPHLPKQPFKLPPSPSPSPSPSHSSKPPPTPPSPSLKSQMSQTSLKLSSIASVAGSGSTSKGVTPQGSFTGLNENWKGREFLSFAQQQQQQQRVGTYQQQQQQQFHNNVYPYGNSMQIQTGGGVQGMNMNMGGAGMGMGMGMGTNMGPSLPIPMAPYGYNPYSSAQNLSATSGSGWNGNASSNYPWNAGMGMGMGMSQPYGLSGMGAFEMMDGMGRKRSRVDG